MIFFVTDRSKYGYCMLEQMGWSEGKGLGKEEEGDTEHIRISKKADSGGQCGIWLVRLRK